MLGGEVAVFDHALELLHEFTRQKYAAQRADVHPGCGLPVDLQVDLLPEVRLVPGAFVHGPEEVVVQGGPQARDRG